jgi:hypothetical protein
MAAANATPWRAAFDFEATFPEIKPPDCRAYDGVDFEAEINL